MTLRHSLKYEDNEELFKQAVFVLVHVAGDALIIDTEGVTDRRRGLYDDKRVDAYKNLAALIDAVMIPIVVGLGKRIFGKTLTVPVRKPRKKPKKEGEEEEEEKTPPPLSVELVAPTPKTAIP